MDRGAVPDPPHLHLLGSRFFAWFPKFLSLADLPMGGWNGAMLQSLLYHAFGIPKTYRYVRTEYEKGAVWFTVRPEAEPECCPHCQSKELVCHGRRARKVRMVPIGLKPVWIKAAVPRYRCKGCGATWGTSPLCPAV